MPEAANTKKQGIFVPTMITYGDKTSIQQAHEIVAIVRKFKEQGYTQVGITYSANYDQTRKIKATYRKGDWCTDTLGSNQAQVIQIVENLLKTSAYQDLQQVFRILPITTCEHAGGVGAVQQTWLQADLDDIQHFVSRPQHVVLGWQNENTGTSSYAVGGSISKNLHTTFVPGEPTKTQHQYVQERLKQLEKQYAPVNEKKSDAASSWKILKQMAIEQPVAPVPQEKLEAKSRKNEEKTSIKVTTPTQFKQSKPLQVELDVNQASQQLVVAIKQKEKHITKDADFIIRKGNLHNTFKVGFTSTKDAQSFFKHLKNIGFDNVSYFGDEELYPMNSNGDVTPSGTYKHIVRFEIPEDGLKYLNSLNISNCEMLYRAIMDAAPAYRSSMRP